VAARLPLSFSLVAWLGLCYHFFALDCFHPLYVAYLKKKMLRCRRPMAHASFFATSLPNASVEAFDLLIFLRTRQNCGNTQ
jgi:hypothetical protein